MLARSFIVDSLLIQSYGIGYFNLVRSRRPRHVWNSTITLCYDWRSSERLAHILSHGILWLALTLRMLPMRKRFIADPPSAGFGLTPALSMFNDDRVTKQ